ncbi:MAG TPA: hypothetical protein VER79_01515 [Candidatus Limnocylindrales bacterium]|nr:hypothetical protein [Candidatus Limnocylindrales bacterium]
MTADSLPSNPEEHDEDSLFDEFINHSLDLDGLEDEETSDEEEGLDFDDPNSILIRFRLPGGIAGGLPGGMLGQAAPYGAGSRGPRLPRIPMRDDVRWQHAVMSVQSQSLKLHQPFFDYRDHDGQLMLPLTHKSARRITFIRNVMPGWTVVRYSPSRGTVGEFTEKTGNRQTQQHQLNLAGKDIAGFVKTEDLPPVRPARIGPEVMEFMLELAGTILVVAAVTFAMFYLLLRLYIGDPPATGALVDRIATLEAQVQALEAPPAPFNDLPPKS